MTKEEEKKQLEEQEKKDKEAIQTIAQAVTPEVIKYFEANKPVRKNVFADGSISERQELAEKKQQAVEFLKAMEKHDYARIKALSSGTATSGLELIPTYVSDQFITVAQKYGLARKYAKKWPMIGISENIPTASTVNAYRLGTDTTSIQSSAATTGAVQDRKSTRLNSSH